MRYNRIFIATELAVGNIINLTNKSYNQVLNVLRLNINDSLILFNGQGLEAKAILIEKTRKEANVKIIEVIEKSLESNINLELGQVISKNSKMDFIIQKATELGTHTISPLISDRNVVKIKHDRLDNKLTHWEQICINSCSQCQRNILPKINNPINILQWLTNNKSQNSDILGVLFTPEAKDNLISLQQQFSNKTTITNIKVLIGPEGGLTADEINFAIECGFYAARLGPRILRAETAAITALSNLQLLFGDLK